MSELIKTTKRDFWLKQIEDWKASTLNQKDFCIQKQLSFVQFIYWRKKCREQAVKDPKDSLQQPSKKWIPLTPAEAFETPS